MQKQKRITVRVSYVLMALLLITYLFFPSWYRAVSQRVFGVVYTRYAESLPSVPAASGVRVVPGELELLPMFVIVRPPQTPYDYVITTVPDQYQRAVYAGVAGVWYVYDTAMRPIGYVEKMYPSLFVVTLFSAPASNELFSVGDYVSRGTGEGGGAFSLQVPIDVAVSVGMPIVHQATGEIVSAVAAIDTVPEKNVRRVIGVLGSSPFEMAVLYMARTPNSALLSESIESAIDAANELSADALAESEGVGDGGDSDQGIAIPETP